MPKADGPPMSESAPRISEKAVEGLAKRAAGLVGWFDWNATPEEVQREFLDDAREDLTAILPLLCGEASPRAAELIRELAEEQKQCADAGGIPNRIEAARAAQSAYESAAEIVEANRGELKEERDRECERADKAERTWSDRDYWTTDTGLKHQEAIDRAEKAEQELEQVKADFELLKKSAVEHLERAEASNRQLFQVREEVERLYEKAREKAMSAAGCSDEAEYELAAPLEAEAGSYRASADRILAILDSSPSLSGGDDRVNWPHTEAGKGRRIERFVIAVEYEVWDEAGLSHQALIAELLDKLPTVIPAEDGDEGAMQCWAKVSRVLPGTTKTSLSGDEDTLQAVAEVGDALESGDVEERGEEEGCDRSPAGWRCTRDAEHDGPCAAVPTTEGDARLEAATVAGRAWMVDHDLGGYWFASLAADVLAAADRELLSDGTVRELTKQIVEGSDGEVISLPYGTVRDALANVLRADSTRQSSTTGNSRCDVAQVRERIDAALGDPSEGFTEDARDDFLRIFDEAVDAGNSLSGEPGDRELLEIAADAVPVIDAVFRYLEESGLAETSIKLYEAIKPLAEIRVRFAELLLTQPKDTHLSGDGERLQSDIEIAVGGLLEQAAMDSPPVECWGEHGEESWWRQGVEEGADAVRCEGCGTEVDPETAWQDSEGVRLCGKCEKEHLVEVAAEDRDDPDYIRRYFNERAEESASVRAASTQPVSPQPDSTTRLSERSDYTGGDEG